MTRVAAIDCGTNSIRLLIAEPGPAGLTELARRTELVRLGQGVDATRRFHPDALARTFAAIDAFAADLRRHEVERVRFVATSATRDVANREEFEAGVRARLGVGVAVIPGGEEARLSFTGALEVLRGRARTPHGPILVTDIGGGSTELVVGELVVGGPGGTITASASLDVGSVRLRERFLTADPIPWDQRNAAAAHVDHLLDACGVPVGSARVWIGVAGTLTSMAAVALGLARYDRAQVHGATLTGEDIAAVTERLIASPVAELEQIPTLPAMRAQVIAGGALVCERIARRVGAPLIVSETDILDAVAAELAR